MERYATDTHDARPRRAASRAPVLIFAVAASAALGSRAAAQDSDGDGLTDAEELALAGGSGCPDPGNADSDGDTLSDGDEVNSYLTDPCNADTDGDGLADDWEQLGIPWTDNLGAARRYVLNLPPTPRRKDVYVEMDAMATHDIGGWQVARVSAALSVANVPNPDGSQGINLHDWIDEIGLNRVTWTYDPSSGVNWPTEFASFKDDHFGSPAERSDPNWYVNGVVGTTGPLRAAKLAAYRYVVFADKLGATTVSGLGELPGNDMVVALGSWGFAGTPLQWKLDVYAGVFMHELGHNLGLGHGGPIGGPNGGILNFKPNHFSVMNYSWTVPRYVTGLSPTPTPAQSAYAASWPLAWSDSAWPSIDETAPVETALCAGGCGTFVPTVAPVGPPQPWGYGFLDAVGSAVDYDRDGFTGGIAPATDVNWVIGSQCPPPAGDWSPPPCPNFQTALPGADDLAGLTFAMTGSANFASGVHGAVLPPGGEMDFETVKMLSLLGGCAWDEDFDHLAAGTSIDGPDGWGTWEGDPASTALVTEAQARSGARSLDVAGPSDVVHEFCAGGGGGGGAWAFTAWQYVPSDFVSGGGGEQAGSWFMLLNTYEPGGPYNWSVQIQLAPEVAMARVFHGDGWNTIDVPYDPDRWVKIQTIVDLDDDWTRVYYDDELVTEYPWTGGVLGEGGGANQIAAVDLYAFGSSSVFYDDLDLRPVESECGADLQFDADGDGLTLLEEFLIGSDPCHPDTDLDGWLDGMDNCPTAFNPDQLDTDLDGIGDACDEPDLEPCPTDLDGSGDTGFGDLLMLLGAWGPCPPPPPPPAPPAPCPADIDGSGDVGFGDLLLMLGGWGECG